MKSPRRIWKGTNPVIDRSHIKLAVVCPMANEKDSAARLVDEVLGTCSGFAQVRFFAILDNACKDGTVDLLRDKTKVEKQLCVVFAPENRCVVDAYLRGYREAIAWSADWILEMDAGFSHQPEDIGRFIAEMEKGKDCVFATRFDKGGTMEESPLKRRVISRGGTMLANLLLGTRLSDMTSGFEMFTREALESILSRGIRSRAHFFQTEIKAYARKMDIAEVGIRYRAPSASVNQKVIGDAFGNLFRIFRLRLAGKL